ncbi:hypothetical protein [Kinneretia aquatilis]|nr:hypothetical protein [Paucibacter aquatile]WIV99789.1 hypothetical protein K9V56_010095 [Paucibacter aquatile]
MNPTQLSTKIKPALRWALILLVLGLVFLAYLQPALMVQLSEQLWACF